MKIKNLLILSSCLLLGRAAAQDPSFSQFFSSPLTLNPANTGNFNGTLRLSGNIRNQWAAFNNPYATYTVSADAPLMQNKIGAKDRMSVGLLLLSDQNGNGLFKQNFLTASFAYKKGFDAEADHSLSFGFQATHGNSRFNTSMANFEDQLTANGFSLATTESIASASKSFFDLNAGMIYGMSTTDDKYFYLGLAAYHLLQPKTSILNSDYTLQPRFNLHGGGYFPAGANATFHASFQYQHQGDFNEWVFGGAYSYFVKTNPENNLELFIGSWLRLNDAIIPYLALEWKQLRIGLSYDVGYTAGKLASSHYQTGEFSVNQVWNSNPGSPLFKCPKF
jgi:type IX secretion system PorP/SprF family membrane protein